VGWQSIDFARHPVSLINQDRTLIGSAPRCLRRQRRGFMNTLPQFGRSWSRRQDHHWRPRTFTSLSRAIITPILSPVAEPAFD
jgi:hypothetical protein